MHRRFFKNSSGASFPRRRESIVPHNSWIPAFAGMTERGYKIIPGFPSGRYIILMFIIILILVSNTAFADSTASLIDRGNKSWIAGEYEAAIKDYDEAAVDDPESPYIYFNKGAALYKKEDYSAAIEEFKKAALKSKDPEMESKCRFNLGNSAFREAERQMDSDLKKALEYCQKSIIHYQDSLKLNPGFKPAAENIEIVRLYMKNILDEIKKKEEEAKEKEEQARQNAEELQKIIKRQENALEENRKISGSQIKQDEKNKKFSQLADGQKKITDDTQKLSDKIQNQSAQQNQGKENPALTHLNNAVKEQEAAEGNLRNSAVSNAQKNQENAIKELKDALTPPEQNQNKQQGSQPNNDQNEQQGQEEQQKQEASQDRNQPQNEDQAEMQEASEDAQDILDEEKENQKQRRMIRPFGYRDVEKDW